MLRYIEVQNANIIDAKAECIVNSISHDMHILFQDLSCKIM